MRICLCLDYWEKESLRAFTEVPICSEEIGERLLLRFVSLFHIGCEQSFNVQLWLAGISCMCVN